MSALPERRLVDRRVDKATSKLMVRSFAMHRAFGFATAMGLLLRAGLSEPLARAALVATQDRRRRTGRDPVSRLPSPAQAERQGAGQGGKEAAAPRVAALTDTGESLP